MPATTTDIVAVRFLWSDGHHQMISPAQLPYLHPILARLAGPWTPDVRVDPTARSRRASPEPPVTAIEEQTLVLRLPSGWLPDWSALEQASRWLSVQRLKPRSKAVASP